MKKYDFVFVYELKNRELESILLLKCELEKRGYSVCLIETWENILNNYKKVKATVVVMFALYCDGQIDYALSFVDECKQFINMQWEQVFTNSDVEKIANQVDFSRRIKENAIYCKHISWGKINYKRLIDMYGVPSSNVFLGGNVSLDFLRTEFCDYFIPKNDIAEKYGLDKKKKIYLFISSFSYVNMPKELIESDMYQNVGFDIKLFWKISCDSQRSILKWFEKELIKHPEIEVVYRPHPAEASGENIRNMKSKYKNFHIVSDLSVKQWILVADKIYTWWSTSIAEIYASGKGCSVLRPVMIPYELDIEAYKNIETISTYAQFDNEYLEQVGFPSTKEVMSLYYDINPEIPSYIRVADFMENVYENEADYKSYYCKKKLSYKEKILRIFKNMIRRIILRNCNLRLWLYKIAKRINQKYYTIIKRKIDNWVYIDQMSEKNKYREREVYAIMEKINNVVCK